MLPRDAVQVQRVRRSALDAAGVALSGVDLGGTHAGAPLAGARRVWVLLGGITADPFPVAEGGWWVDLAVALGIDLEQDAVLSPMLLGGGSAFDGFPPAGGALPRLSPSGLADAVAAWLDGVGATAPLFVLGASLGGLVGLALAERHAARVEWLVTVSAGGRPDPWGTATRHLQRRIVRRGLETGDLDAAMDHARQLGMLTYRGRPELSERFGPLAPDADEPPIAAYLDHNGGKFARTFDPWRFLLLSTVIDRAALDTPEQLAAIEARVDVVGVPDDLLFPYALQRDLDARLRATGVAGTLHTLEAATGHDAFLTHARALGEMLRPVVPR